MHSSEDSSKTPGSNLTNQAGLFLGPPAADSPFGVVLDYALDEFRIVPGQFPPPRTPSQGTRGRAFGKFTPMKLHLRSAALGLGILATGLATEVSAQQMPRNTTDIPTSTGYTENVDFGDVDNDGDWDAIFADGGDNGNDQSKIWINQGFAQGGTVGIFVNRTAQQFPVVQSSGRDIEFVDFDNDADLDIYVSNTSQITQQSNKWWTNMGGAQGGTIGFYQDQTAARWSGLGGAGSSIAPSQVLVSGGYIDFSCDCDFGDLDNDGDLDLVHSSYGGAFGGQLPTRLFLNNGAGVFSEFNPSGFQLAGQTIVVGNPAVWAQGTQATNTTNATGANADIASSALDIDLADIDGDMDLDILHGARQEVPRLFQSRFADSGDVLTAFRDVTGSNFPAGYSTGDGHYEQEMGDFDGDGDVDIYGLNWAASFGFTDVTMKNTGAGTFNTLTNLTNSDSDDNEGDFFDYDNDGDIDLFVANFAGQERVYRNNGTGAMTYQNTGVVVPTDGTISLDADCCDVDGDQDYDVFVANDTNTAEWYLKNSTVANDTFAPIMYRLTQAANRVAGPAPTVIRVQVYDNAPYYITWFNNTRIEYQVNGGPVQTVAMLSVGGQIFRGLIPGNVVGTITYRVVSSDKYNNTGNTGTLTYTATSGATGTPFCFGDGSGAACPCSNNAAAGSGTGCLSSLGFGGRIAGTGSASLASDSLVLTGTGMPNSSALYFQGTAQAGSGAGTVFGDGLRCAAGSVIRLGTKNNVGGTSSYPVGADASVSVRGAVTAGATRYYQVWYRNAAAFCTASTFNLTNGLSVTWAP